MPISHFALILGVLCYLFGLPMLFAEKRSLAWRKKFLKNDALLRVIGGAFVVMAVLVLKIQWYITQDADGIIVLLAWMSLFKCLLLVWWTDQYAQFALRMEARMESVPALHLFCGLIKVALGAFLTYLGWIMV